jgi:hypothetical protein
LNSARRAAGSVIVCVVFLGIGAAITVWMASSS